MRCIALFTASLVGFFFGLLMLASAQDAREPRAAPTGSKSQVVRLEVTRDTWVSEVGQEADGNNGGAPRLKLKSIQEMTLIDVDPAPLRGRVVAAAALHLKSAGDPPLRRVTVGGIGAQWFEGSGSGYAQQAGGATFRHRRHPDLPWSIARPGGDLCHVILGNGGTNWGMADATPPDADGWQSIADQPGRSGRPRGGAELMGSWSSTTPDRSGPTRATGSSFALFPNRFVYSRDQNRASAPFLTVTLGPEDREPPAAPDELDVRIQGPAPG